MAATPISQSTAGPVPGPSSGDVDGPATPPRPLLLFDLECSLGTAPFDVLESAARTLSRSELSQRFADGTGTVELTLLRTCHRVELVGLVRAPEEIDRWRRSLPGPLSAWRYHEGREVVRHVFRVAAGHGSLAQGETEVREQVRGAGRAVLSRHPRPVLRAMFDRATAAARALSDPHEASRSIASVAADHLRTLVSTDRPRVLVVGAGTVGRQVAESLAPHAQVTVLFHQRPPPPSFLEALGADAQPLEVLPRLAATADAIVGAAKLGGHRVGAEVLPRDRPIVVVDLGMPRNFDAAVRSLPKVRLVDLQELYDRARVAGRPPIPDARLEARVDECAEVLERWLWEPWVAALYRAAEATRRSELSTAGPFLRNLDPGDAAAVDLLTRRLVARLLGRSAERIRSLPPGPEGDVRRRLAWELLGPATPEP